MASPELHSQEKLFYLLENVFNYINREVIALEDKDVKRNNVLLNVVSGFIIDFLRRWLITLLIAKMRVYIQVGGT